MKMNLREIACQTRRWIKLNQDRAQRLVLVLKETENLKASEAFLYQRH
jgi:hypothetical protein